MKVGIVGYDHLGLKKRMSDCEIEVIEDPTSVISLVDRTTKKELYGEKSGETVYVRECGVFLMVEDRLNELVKHCESGDIIMDHTGIDPWEARNRAERLAKLGIQYLTLSTWLDSVMASGPQMTLNNCTPILKSLSPRSNWHENVVWWT